MSWFLRTFLWPASIEDPDDSQSEDLDPLVEHREVVVAVLGTTLCPRSPGRVVSVSCIELVNKVPTGNTFHRYVNPGVPIQPEARKWHGISDAMVHDKPYFPEVAWDIMGFIRDDNVVVYSYLEINTLNRQLTLIGLPEIPPEQVITILGIVRKRISFLNTLCAYYHVPTPENDALAYAKQIAGVYPHLRQS